MAKKHDGKKHKKHGDKAKRHEDHASFRGVDFAQFAGIATALAQQAGTPAGRELIAGALRVAADAVGGKGGVRRAAGGGAAAPSASSSASDAAAPRPEDVAPKPESGASRGTGEVSGLINLAKSTLERFAADLAAPRDGSKPGDPGIAPKGKPH